MPLSTRDISRRDDHGELCWDDLAPEEREWAWEIMREKEEERERRNHAIRVAVALFIAALVVVLFASSSLPAWGHDFWINHSGYKSLTDGTHCCGNNDCFEYTPEEVSAEHGGWLIKPLGELVPYSDTQASEDGKFWRCKRHDGARRCFFAPQPSS